MLPGDEALAEVEADIPPTEIEIGAQPSRPAHELNDAPRLRKFAARPVGVAGVDERGRPGRGGDRGGDGVVQPVLTDQFEYAYLAHRPSASDYFWDMQGTTDARTLEQRLVPGDAVVATFEGSGFPPGFVPYLEKRHYPEVRTPAATIWLIPDRKHRVLSLASPPAGRSADGGG